uniref:ELMO domain-containing protein n=1 Tax=Strigamia maritima TaxID=126957 RepID=T1JJM1_STRMM
MMDGDSELIMQTERMDDNKAAAVYKHRLLVDNDYAKQELEKAQTEWETVNSTRSDTNVNSWPGNTEIITIDDVISHFKSADMSIYMANIVPVIERSKLASLFRLIWGPPVLDSSLDDERKLVFAIASCPFHNEEIVHLRVLQSIYKLLTNNQNDCPRYGSHWEQIGFQGNDPSTDLRGVGFLGLLHLLYIVMNPQTLSLARDILQLSRDEKQNFPFAVMGINLTRIVLQALREERLNKECNRKKNVILVVNEFYVGIFLHLYNIWSKNNVTIESSGFILKDVESTVKKRPKVLLRNLEDYINTKNKLETNSSKLNPAQTTQETRIFSDIESELRFVDDEIT